MLSEPPRRNFFTYGSVVNMAQLREIGGWNKMALIYSILNCICIIVAALR